MKYWSRRRRAISTVRVTRSRTGAVGVGRICSRPPRGCSPATASPRRRWRMLPRKPASPCRRSTITIRARRIWRTIPIQRLARFYAEFVEQTPLRATMREHLHRFLSAATEYARRNPDWARLLYLEIWPSVLIHEARVRRAVDDFGRIVVEMLREGGRRGEWDARLDPYRTATILMGSITHMIITWLLYRRPEESQQGHQTHGGPVAQASRCGRTDGGTTTQEPHGRRAQFEVIVYHRQTCRVYRSA